MSASLKFIAPGITADATSQPEFDRYLATPAAEACDAMQWWAANAHRYRNTARLAKATVCSGRLLVSASTDGNGDRFLSGYNDSTIGNEKNSSLTSLVEIVQVIAWIETFCIAVHLPKRVTYKLCCCWPVSLN